MCIAERCAGPFWYSYRISLHLPLFSTVLICLSSHWSIILWPTQFKVYTVHYRMLFSLSSTFSWPFLLYQRVHRYFSSLALSLFLSLSPSLQDICVKCTWGMVPPCSEQMYILYISYCCVVLKRNINGLSLFFLVKFINSVYSLSLLCEADPQSRCSLK